MNSKLGTMARAVAAFACLNAAAAEPRSSAGKEAAPAVAAGDREKAALMYSDLKAYGTAQILIMELIRESPQEPGLRHDLACILARAGDRGGSLEALGEARKRQPGAVLRQRMAFLYQDMKDYGPARELLDGLVAEAPGDLGVRLDRASLAAQTGDVARGIAELAAASALRPGPEERRRMASLYQKLRTFDRARALIDGLIEDSPRDARPRLDLASLAARSGDRASAVEALAAARARGPGLDDLGRIASLYQELREFDQARAVLEDLIRGYPRNARARIDLAALHARRGERAAALSSLAAARRLAPDLQERQAMSLLYEDLQEYRAARRMADDLVAEQPQDPQLRLNRAHFAADVGDRAAALVFIAEARARSPDPDDRRRMAILYDRLGAAAEARALRDELDKKSR